MRSSYPGGWDEPTQMRRLGSKAAMFRLSGAVQDCHQAVAKMSPLPAHAVSRVDIGTLSLLRTLYRHH